MMRPGLGGGVTEYAPGPREQASRTPSCAMATRARARTARIAKTDPLQIMVQLKSPAQPQGLLITGTAAANKADAVIVTIVVLGEWHVVLGAK